MKPDGMILLAFHIGEGTVHFDEWWDKKVNLDFNYLETNDIVEKLKTAGFELMETIEREPYPDVEHQSRRAYIFARRPF